MLKNLLFLSVLLAGCSQPADHVVQSADVYAASPLAHPDNEDAYGDGAPSDAPSPPLRAKKINL